MTAEQRARHDAEGKKRQQEAAARKEQQRKDQALLNTYSSAKDIEAMRQRANAEVKKSIRDAEVKIADIRKQRQKYENEAEFYRKKPLPAEVRKGLDNSDFEIKAQKSIIEAKKKELDIIREKYDDDLRRFIELTRGKAPDADHR